MSIKIITDNKKAYFDFEILEKYEAGIALLGSEVKSLRQGGANLKDSYVAFRGHEAFLQKSHISVYAASSYNNHDPERLRKLLLNHNELVKIASAIQEKGLTCVPLKLYFKKGRVKVEIGLARGKNKGDKRTAAKKKDAQREVQRAMRHSR